MTFFGAFKSYITLNRVEIMEDVEVERVERIEEIIVEEEKDCEIIGIK